MKVILAAIESPLVEAWEKFCGELDCVSVYRGSILDVTCDALVSPANSFGFMDGGIDLRYSQHFGWQVQDRLQQLIQVKHHGELLVGSAEIVETNHPQIPYLIAAPTMRVPMLLRDTVHPYLAARAALLLVKHGTTSDGLALSDVVKTVGFPGLGTGVGQVHPEVCAKQVREAIKEVILENQLFPTSWDEAQARHQKLYTDRTRDLQFE